jgi:hypothetical protein
MRGAEAAPTDRGRRSLDGSFRAGHEGGNEMQSGEKLLVEAYAALWADPLRASCSSRGAQKASSTRAS